MTARLRSSLTCMAQFSSISVHHFPIALLAQTSKFHKTAGQLAEDLRWSFHCIHCWRGLGWSILATVKNCVSKMKLPTYTTPENNPRPRKLSPHEKFEWMREEECQEMKAEGRYNPSLQIHKGVLWRGRNNLPVFSILVSIRSNVFHPQQGRFRWVIRITVTVKQ